MALFDSFRPKPLDYYLDQRPAAVLREAALNTSWIGFHACATSELLFPEGYRAPSSPFPLFEVYYCVSVEGLRDDPNFNGAGMKPIPLRYKNQDVSPERLLELACEKGDPDAPFYLSLMYEYGMTGETLLACSPPHAAGHFKVGKDPLALGRNKIRESCDPERAALYMQTAQERGCDLTVPYMALATILLEENKSDGVIEQSDHKLSDICRSLFSDILHEFYGDPKSHITPEAVRKLSRFLGVLLSFYAGQEFPCATVYLAQFLIDLLDEFKGSAVLFAKKRTDLFGYYKFKDLPKEAGRFLARMEYLKNHGDRGINYILLDKFGS